jgi:hypothetical protein
MKIRVGITGPTGSGKTYSAILIALGMGLKISMIDTEHGSGSAYDFLGEYYTLPLEPPYSPDRYIRALDDAAKEGFEICIIDSLSHAWVGQGGILDMHGKATRASRSKNSYTAWRDISPKHTELVEAILACPMHVIATMRSKMAYAMEDSSDTGKTRIATIGMQPIQREGMTYEFMTVFDLSQEHLAVGVKDRTNLFPLDDPFTPDQETGKKIMDWYNSGVPVQEPEKLPLEELLEQMKTYTEVGSLLDWCREGQIQASEAALSEGDREHFLSELRRYKGSLMPTQGKD